MALPQNWTLPPGLRETMSYGEDGLTPDYVDVGGRGGWTYRDDGTWGRWNRDITGYDEGGGEMLGASYFTPYTATQDFAQATPGAWLQDMKWWGTPNTGVDGATAHKWISPSGAEPTVVRDVDGTLKMQLPADAMRAPDVTGEEYGALQGLIDPRIEGSLGNFAAQAAAMYGGTAGLAGLAGGTAAGTAGTAGVSLNNSIYQDLLQNLVGAGVPFEVAAKISDAINSALQGGALSKLTGGDFATGAGMGAIGSVIGNVANSFGYNLPTSVIGLATRALSSGLGLLGDGSSAGPSSGLPAGAAGQASRAAGQASGASLLGGQAPRSGMLSFAPTGPLSMAGRPSQAPALFAGIKGGVDPYQAPMQEVNLSNLPFDETLFAAKGGLMHLAEGGQLEKNIAALQKLLSPAEKSVSQGEQIKNYLTRKALADSKLDFVSPLQSRTVKGRAGKSQMFAGLPQEAIPDVPRMAATNYGISPLRESVDFIPRARIPFAAHGGQIHPMLSRVLKDRGVEFVPGPEGRMYARHKERGFAVGGAGTGQSDDIPTMLSDGEYVIDADTVAALGDGSSKAGAAILDKFRESIRKHKRSAPLSEIPPKAKRPEQYLKGK
jgi:hypothetical protein